MSQSRFSIVLVGVSALLRRPLVSRLRPAGFTARGSGGFHRSALPSVSEIAAGRVDASAFHFGVAAGRVGLRAHGFRFSARTASGLPSASWFFCLPFRRWPLGGLGFGLTLRGCPRRVGLRAHGFRFSARTASELPSAGWPSGSRLPLFGTHRIGDCPRRAASSAFRFGVAVRRVGLRAHCFRFSACAASEWPLGEFVLPPSVSEITAGRVGLRVHRFRFSACAASEWLLGEFVLPPSASEIPLGGLAFGLTASAFRHAPLRSGRWADWPSGFRFGVASAGWFFRWAGWSSGSLLPLFGLHRFGVAAGRVRSSAFRFGVAARRVGLRAHCFRFSACTTSGLPLGGLVFTPSVSELPLGELAFGLTAFAFRHAPIRTAAPPKRGPTEHTDTTLVSLQNTYPNMLTYHIVRRKHFKTGKLLYYPQLVTPVADDHMHIIERIEKKCTLASADVKAVVDALEVEIIDSLRQGRSVRLGDLGSFRPTLRCSAGVDLSELAGVGQIKRVHVVFHPSSRIRRALSVKDHAVSFVQRDKKKHGANAQQGGSPTGGATPGAPAPSTGSSAAGSAVTPPGTPVPAPPSTGTPAGTPVPAAPSPTTSTTTGTPAPSTGSSAAGSAVTPPGTPVPAPPSTGTPAGTPVPAAPSPTTSTTTGTPAPSTGSSAAGSAVTPPGTPVPAPPSTGTPAGTPVPAAPSPTTSTTTGTPAPSTGTPAAGGA